jgi:CheY-like chemotaxis protein
MAPPESTAEVVIIGNNEHVRRLLCVALERMGGLRAVEANSEADARSRLGLRPPKAIVLDLREVEGLEVLQRLRGRPALQDVPIVLVVSSDSSLTQRRASRLGADAVYAKPFSPRALVAGLFGRTWPSPPCRLKRSAEESFTE